MQCITQAVYITGLGLQTKQLATHLNKCTFWMVNVARLSQNLQYIHPYTVEMMGGYMFIALHL